MLHARADEDKLDLWLISGAEKFRRDPELRRALLTAAEHEDTRRCLLLLAAILETPALADRLLEVLRPELAPRKKSLALVNGARASEPVTQEAPKTDKVTAARAALERRAARPAATNGKRPASTNGKSGRR
jgi:hypothetical protein